MFYYLINTAPKYGEPLLRTFSKVEEVQEFLMMTDNPNRYKVVFGEEMEAEKKTTVILRRRDQ